MAPLTFRFDGYNDSDRDCGIAMYKDADETDSSTGCRYAHRFLGASAPLHADAGRPRFALIEMFFETADATMA